MKEYIDEMLHLTADIAEGLLTLKDNGNGIDSSLADKIARLAEIAAANVGQEALAADTNKEPGDESDVVMEITTESTVNEAVAESTEMEEIEDAEPDAPNSHVLEQTQQMVSESESESVHEPEEHINEQEPEKGSEPVIMPGSVNEHEPLIMPDQVHENEPILAEEHETVGNTVSPEELRNAFTINDVFLYQRVLFRGSAKGFAEALDYAAECGDIEEFRRYLAEEFHISLKSGEAKDFISIIHQFI